MRRYQKHQLDRSRRLLILGGAQLACFGLIGLRYSQLQLMQRDAFQLASEKNRVRTDLIAPKRGEIRDRRNRPLAVNKVLYRLVYDKQALGALDAERRFLKEYNPPLAKISNDIKADTQTSSAREMTWRALVNFTTHQHRYPHFSLHKEVRRVYPEAHIAVHLVGYVARPNEKESEKFPPGLVAQRDFKVGKSGIELAQQKVLSGQFGVSYFEANAKGEKLRKIQDEPEIAGKDISLTIDLNFQKKMHQILQGKGGVQEAAASAVLLDARTGAILSCASVPTYDPNDFVIGMNHKTWGEIINHQDKPLNDKAISMIYPPGSTFKMMVGLAALEAGVVSPNETIFCPGHYQAQNRRFHCWKAGGHGRLRFTDAISQSCNVYFYELASRVGVDKINAMAKRFGFGAAVCDDLLHENDGLLPSRAWKFTRHGKGWYLGDTLNLAIGQGYMLATPLQLATMAARLATGLEINPYVIRDYGQQHLHTNLDVSPEHLKLVRHGMWKVVNHYSGSSFGGGVDVGMGLAGKTGTVQVINRRVVSSKLADKKTERQHSLFVGYAPYDNPIYAVSVVVEHGGFGSRVAAPIGKSILKQALDWNWG